MEQKIFWNIIKKKVKRVVYKATMASFSHLIPKSNFNNKMLLIN